MSAANHPLQNWMVEISTLGVGASWLAGLGEASGGFQRSGICYVIYMVWGHADIVVEDVDCWIMPLDGVALSGMTTVEAVWPSRVQHICFCVNIFGVCGISTMQFKSLEFFVQTGILLWLTFLFFTLKMTHPFFIAIWYVKPGTLQRCQTNTFVLQYANAAYWAILFHHCVQSHPFCSSIMCPRFQRVCDEGPIH